MLLLNFSCFLVSCSQRGGHAGQMGIGDQSPTLLCTPLDPKSLCHLVVRGIIISELEITNWELVTLFLLGGGQFTEVRGEGWLFTVRIRRKKWIIHSRESAPQKSGQDSIFCLKLIVSTMSWVETTSLPAAPPTGRNDDKEECSENVRWTEGKWSLSLKGTQGRSNEVWWDWLGRLPCNCWDAAV